MIKPVLRTLILNKNGQYTITLPREIMANMGAKPGDRFKFKYEKDMLILKRMGCDAI